MGEMGKVDPSDFKTVEIRMYRNCRGWLVWHPDCIVCGRGHTLKDKTSLGDRLCWECWSWWINYEL